MLKSTDPRRAHRFLLHFLGLQFVAQFDDAKAATKAAVSESGASSMARQRVTASPTGSSSSSHSEQSESNSGMSNGTSSNDVGKSTSLVGKETKSVIIL